MEHIADFEQAHDEQHAHRFCPEDWPENVSHVPYSEKEKSDLDRWPSHEKHLALDKQKRFLPCHYFDYIGGSSTGG